MTEASAMLRLTVTAVVAALLLQACAGRPASTETADTGAVEIDNFVIRNQLPFVVTDVFIESPATGNFVGCGNMLPRSQCSSPFQSRVYRRDGIVIRWREFGEPQETGEFVVELPANRQPNRPFSLEVTIFARGQAGARLVQ